MRLSAGRQWRNTNPLTGLSSWGFRILWRSRSLIEGLSARIDIRSISCILSSDRCEISNYCPIMDVLQQLPVSIQAVCGVAVLGMLYYAIIGGQRPYAGFPLVTLEEQGWKTWLGGPSKTEWMAHCADLLKKGRKLTNGCFQVRASSGYKIVVPNRFTDELRNHPAADFGLSMRKDMMSDYEGLEGAREASDMMESCSMSSASS